MKTDSYNPPLPEWRTFEHHDQSGLEQWVASTARTADEAKISGRCGHITGSFFGVHPCAILAVAVLWPTILNTVTHQRIWRVYGVGSTCCDTCFQAVVVAWLRSTHRQPNAQCCAQTHLGLFPPAQLPCMSLASVTFPNACKRFWRLAQTQSPPIPPAKLLGTWRKTTTASSVKSF